MVRQWLLAVVVLFAGQAFGVEYYWENTSYSNHWKTPQEACWSGSPDSSAYVYEFQILREGKYVRGFCRKKRTFDDAFIGTMNFYLRGDSCATGKVWDEETFSCICPPGQEKGIDGVCYTPSPCEAGQELLTRGPDSPVANVSGRTYVLSTPPSSVCSSSCQYVSTSSKAASCYLLSGASGTGFCNYSMTSDGERCSGEEPSPADVGDPLNPEEPPESPTQPSDPDDPGCPVGQAWSGTDCTQEPSSGEPGGESGDGGDDDPADVPCDRDGTCWEEGDNGGSGSGSGSGSGTGSGSGSGDDGGGDGIGDGDGDDDGEGECDPSQGYVCGGGKGPESSLNAPESGSWDKANEEWDQRLEDAKKELRDKVKANVDQMKGAFNLQLSGGAGRLPCDSITVWGKSYRFCVADYGDQLANLRLALLLMAAVIAALIVLKE